MYVFVCEFHTCQSKMNFDSHNAGHLDQLVLRHAPHLLRDRGVQEKQVLAKLPVREKVALHAEAVHQDAPDHVRLCAARLGVIKGVKN